MASSPYSSSWTPDQNKKLEEAVELFGEDNPDRWQKVASSVGDGKTADDAESQCDILLHTKRIFPEKKGSKRGHIKTKPSICHWKANRKIYQQYDGASTRIGDELEEKKMSEKAIMEHPKIEKYKRTSHMVSVQENREFEDLSEYLKRCFLYCSLFPLDYEFEKDTLVQFWIAEGFIEAEETKRMEDNGSVYFDELLSKKFIVPSKFNGFMGNLKYKVSHAATSYLEKAFSKSDYLRAEDQKLRDASGLTLHLSLLCKDIDQMTFETLQNCKRLHTLLLLRDYRYRVKQVPRNFFLNLRQLRTLDLSRTHISELPSSIGNMKSLRYLDVSETPIRRLPDSIDCLCNLQTLKLRGCLGLVGLPKGMNKLTNLRHLYLDNVIPGFKSMPKGMGNLTSLQTLRAFLVDREDGCRIVELKHMNYLRGPFCISRLENVLNFEEAKEAALSDKKYLDKLELQWSNLHNEKAVEEEEDVIELLQPHTSLKEIEILFYGGSKLPSWISNPSFADLFSITLFNCTNCHHLPSLGELPSLKFLYIFEMNMVEEINHQFCRSGVTRGHQAFPKLEKLAIDAMLNLEEWIGVEKGDCPCLIKLTVEYCPKLVALPQLSCIKSLEHLEINHCPKILSLPEEGLPSSVEFVVIRDCPALKERCCKEKGEDWPKIANVPSLWIDHQEISSSSNCRQGGNQS